MTAPILQVNGLSIEFPSASGWVRVVDDVSLAVGAGETVGLVGESGSGKSVSALGVLGLTRAQGGRVAAGTVVFEGQELSAMSERALRDVRGRRIGMIFQQPLRSLNPSFTIGEQIAETLRRHTGASRSAARRSTVELLDRVHIPEPAKRAKQYPHEFSGGMCQRAMIAMALSCSPSLLIADEPTTALDVTVQDVILELMQEIQRETGIAILFISHDLGVIAEMANDVVVMYAGQVVEHSSIEDLFTLPRHPYTAALMASVPRLSQGRRFLTIPGTVPDPASIPAGCRFHPRCEYAVEGRCDVSPVPLTEAASRTVRCVRAPELHLDGVAVRPAPAAGAVVPPAGRAR